MEWFSHPYPENYDPLWSLPSYPLEIEEK